MFVSCKVYFHNEDQEVQFELPEDKDTCQRKP